MKKKREKLVVELTSFAIIKKAGQSQLFKFDCKNVKNLFFAMFEASVERQEKAIKEAKLNGEETIQKAHGNLKMEDMFDIIRMLSRELQTVPEHNICATLQYLGDREWVLTVEKVVNAEELEKAQKAQVEIEELLKEPPSAA